MRISHDLVDELLEHAMEEEPLECCGLIGGLDGEAMRVYRCENAAASELRYEIAGDDQFHTQLRMEREGLDLLAIYHSHTHAEPYPTQSDIDLAAYPALWYVIVGLPQTDSIRVYEHPEVWAYRIYDGRVQAEQKLAT